MKTPLLQKQAWLLFFAFALCSLRTTAQTADASFLSPVVTSDAYYGALEIQSDGKLLVGGSINLFGSQAVPSLTRLRTDGTLDNTFKSALGNTSISGIKQLRTGDLIVWNSSSIYRLKRDGSVAASIYVGNISTVKVTLTGDLLVCGYGFVAKYSANLVLDEDFNNSWSAANGWIFDMAFQGTKIVIVGNFTQVLGKEMHDVARLNLNGTLDQFFHKGGSGTSQTIRSVAVQADKKILLGTWVEYFDGAYIGGSCRLNDDGSIDDSWNVDTGDFQRITYKNGIVYFNDGWRIYAYTETGAWADYYAYNIGSDLKMAVRDDGNYYAGNALYLAGNGLLLFNQGGDPVGGFAPAYASKGRITHIAKGPSRIFIAGEFSKVNGHNSYTLAALNENGSVDTGFSSTNYWLSSLNNIEALGDGGVLVSRNYGHWLTKVGSNGAEAPFYFASGYPKYYSSSVKRYDDDRFVWANVWAFGRANNNGSDDSYFINNVRDWSTWEADIDIQPSTGKLIVGGYGYYLNGQPFMKIALLNQNGTIDGSFKVGGDGPNSYITDVVALQNDEFFVRGYFGNWNGVYTPYNLVKLKKTGALDERFLQNFNTQGIWHFNRPTAFRNKMIAAVGAGGTPVTIRGLDYTGKLSSASFAPRGTVFNEITNFYAPDNNSLYVSGDIILRGQTVSKSLVKINYSEMATPTWQDESSSARAADKTDSAKPKEVAKDASFAFKVYPNPSAEYIKVETEEPAVVKIYSLDGQLKLNAATKSSADMIDVRGLKPGRYVVKIETSGVTRTEHFVVK